MTTECTYCKGTNYSKGPKPVACGFCACMRLLPDDAHPAHETRAGLCIGFAGASGTGKTTLADAVSVLYNLPVNPVGARWTADRMALKTPYEADAAGRRPELQSLLMRWKDAWESIRPTFITDRTPLDNVAYTILHSLPTFTEEYLAYALKGMRRYDLVFFCSIEDFWDPGQDAARQHSEAYQIAYEATLTGLLARAFQDSHDRVLHRVFGSTKMERLASVTGVIAEFIQTRNSRAEVLDPVGG